MRRLSAIFLAAVLFFTLTACGDNTVNKITGKDYPVIVYGVELDECPQKVICLSPAVTDVIYALGSDAQLIGVSDNCDNQRGLEVYGSGAMPDTDKIAASDAQIVICDSGIPDDAKKQITGSGKQVITTPAVYTYSQLKALYEAVASIFSGYSTGKSNAENTFNRIDKRVSAVKAKTEEGNKVSAIILLSDGIAAPKDSFADQMLGFAGGKNVAGDSYAIDYADIIKANPEHIFCPADMVDGILSDEALSDVTAVKNKNVTALSPLYFERYGENVALGLEIMASSLHPEAVKSPIE